VSNQTYTTLRAIADGLRRHPRHNRVRVEVADGDVRLLNDVLTAHADAWEADRIMLDGAGKTNDELWKRIAALEYELAPWRAFAADPGGTIRRWWRLAASSPPGEEGT